MLLFIRNRKGFGILEVIIAGAMMSIIALGIASVMTDMQKSSKHLEAVNGALELAKAVSNLLSNSNVCTANLAGKNVDNSVQTSDLVDALGATVYDVNSTTAYENRNLLFASFRIANTGAGYSVRVAGPPAQVTTRMVLVFTKNSPTSSSGFSTFTREINLFVTHTGDSTTPIASCRAAGIASDLLWNIAPDTVSIFNTNAGNVSVGTNAPPVFFTVSRDSTVRPAFDAAEVTQVHRTNDSVYGTFSNSTTSLGLGVLDNGSNSNWNGANEGAFVGTLTNTPLHFRTNNTERIRITTTGDIGIGTTSPRGALDVSAGAIRARAGAPVNDASAVGISFEDNGDTGLFLTGWTGPATGDLSIYSNSNQSLTVFPDGSATIPSRLGIGAAANPVNPLALNGNASIVNGSLGFNRNPTDGSLPPNGNNAWGRYQLTTQPTYFGIEAYAAGSTLQSGGIAILASNGNVGMGLINPTEKLQVNGNIGVETGFGFIYMSDLKLKKNMTPLDGLQIIQKLTGYRFNWKSDNKKDIGVVAQEVEAVLPEAVKVASDGMKSVDYPRLIPPLIQAIKEQQSQIEALRKQVQALQRSSAK